MIDATEFGAVLMNNEDKRLWQYYRLHPDTEPYVRWKHAGRNLYDLVFLEGAPSVNISNSSDPPGSFHSRDLYERHPTIDYLWKYMYRIDDRMTLINGEEVLPYRLSPICDNIQL